VVRARLVDALAARFDVDLTVLVAGAGFGKTTALAQALRANEAAPRGIDAWVACEPSDEDAARLGAAVAAALGSDDGPADPLERALDALRRTAPVDTCLVLDDLHELAAGSPGERFVVDLATHLPAHAHLVLASRTPVPVPLARRRAAGQVAELDADALAFTAAEVSSLTRLVGGDEGACADLAGWPSLVRLVLSAPTGAMRQFLWEEIVTRLDARERAGLLALATLGSGTAAELTAVAGVPVDADALVTRVPLLHRD
jgi:ATP/maltotriose-dependent transcriptional regulator MalT